MSFELEMLTKVPSAEAIQKQKKSELCQVAAHYTLTITTGMKKKDILKIAVDYLVTDKIIPESALSLITGSYFH